MKNKVKRKWREKKTKTYLKNGIDARVTEGYSLEFRS